MVFAQSFHLPGGGGPVIAIELGVMAVVALADNQHNVRGTIGTAIHLVATHRLFQTVYLCGSQLVAEDAEHKTIDGQIEFHLIGINELTLHLSDGFITHQSDKRFLIL